MKISPIQRICWIVDICVYMDIWIYIWCCWGLYIVHLHVTYKHIHIHIHIHIHVHIHLHMYIYIYIMHIYIYILCIYIYNLYLFIHMFVYACLVQKVSVAHMDIYTYIYIMYISHFLSNWSWWNAQNLVLKPQVNLHLRSSFSFSVHPDTEGPVGTSAATLIWRDWGLVVQVPPGPPKKKYVIWPHDLTTFSRLRGTWRV